MGNHYPRAANNAFKPTCRIGASHKIVVASERQCNLQGGSAARLMRALDGNPSLPHLETMIHTWLGARAKLRTAVGGAGAAVAAGLVGQRSWHESGWRGSAIVARHGLRSGAMAWRRG